MRFAELRKLVEQLVAGAGGGSGGGGTTVVHSTDVPDQTVTLADDSMAFPQDLATLWTLEGPGLFQVGIWYEISPFDDNDYVAVTLVATSELDAEQAITMGPDSRAFASNGGTGSVVPGAAAWLRQRGGDFAPQILMTSESREYKLRIGGFHYHEDDPGDTTAPVVGDVQIRNMHVVAVRLD
jgi:hypothetical protein